MKIILDTDAKNEIDDQYAITYAVLSQEIKIAGFTAAHYAKPLSMEKSYEEIVHVLRLLGKENQYPVLRGAEHALKDKGTPVDSPAARFIIDEALNNSGEPLYVVSIGAITNLASALLIEPGIKAKIKAVWIAGKRWPQGGFCFNDENDVCAGQTVFDSDVDLTLMTICHPARRLKIYYCDKRRVNDKGAIGDYLWKLFMRRRWGLPKPVYDVAVIAALKHPEWCRWERAARPALMDNGKYDHAQSKGLINVVKDIDEGKMREDLFFLLNSGVRK